MVFTRAARQPAMIIDMPSPFPYQIDHAVPWRYGDIIHRSSDLETTAESSRSLVNNIVSSGGMTRSEQVYLPHDARRLAKGKEVISEDSSKTAPEKVETTDEEFLRIMK